MPKVAAYTGPLVQQRGIPDAYQRVTGSPQDFGAGIGQALQGAGQQMDGLAAELERRALKQKQQDDEAAAKQADTAFNGALRGVLFDPDQGFYTKQGKLAVDSLADTMKAVEGLRDTYGKDLTKDQRRLFDDVATRRTSSALDDMSRHVAKERRVWLDTASEARIADATSDGASHHTDPGRINQSLVVGRNEILDQAERNGWSPEVTRLKLERFQSDLHKAVITNRMVNDPLGAQTYFNSVRDRILGTELDTIERGLKVGVTKRTAENIVSDITTGGTVVAQSVAAEARAQGVDQRLALTTAQIESGMGTVPDSPGNSHKGLFQLGPTEWAQHGGGDDPANRAAQVRAGIAALKKAQDAAGKALGREPEPWEVYLTHQQGVAGGPALLKADPNAKAADVLAPFYRDGQAVRAITGNLPKGAGAGADTTVGDFLDVWRKGYDAAAAKAAKAATGATPSLADWLDKARTVADPDVRAHVESGLVTAFNRHEAAIKEGERASRDHVWKMAIDPAIRSVDQIPNDKWAALSGETQRSVMTYLEHKAAGKPVHPTAENQAEYYRLTGMASQDPAAFVDLDLYPYAMKLPHAQWQQLVNQQSAINRKDATEADKAASVTKAMGLITPAAQAAGVKFSGKRTTSEKETAAIFQGQISEALLQFQTENKRRPNDAEMLDIGHRLLVKGSVPGQFWGTNDMRLFAARAAERDDFHVTVADIPKTDKEMIRDAFTKKHQREPTEAEVVHRFKLNTMNRKP